MDPSSQMQSLTLDDVPETKEARGKRVLDSCKDRVSKLKKARIHTKRVQLQAELLAARDRLDECQLSLEDAEDVLTKVQPFLYRAKAQNVIRLVDKRNRFIEQVMAAESAIMDFTADEE